ncbi:hypothetical protein E1287_15445 [Actinomadura sp. KC06]|uniref:hypothetical protein n=1 Tax=Actinomadura sp. KC06 TaxID=2530369 RepID=UPI0010460777|nr:hypothetical protein [Actinomadura sp. KC06]TDD34867.1 hypothetical protein E1287_15445 [Actinomadura sp. KC06]
MREIRSADPWSAFLAPSGRSAAAAARPGTGEYRRPPGDQPGEPGEPGGPGEQQDAEDVRRRVLAQLRAAQGPMSLERIHHATRLGLLEVAKAVDALRARGLVSVEREVDEIVRLTESDG